MKDEKKEKKNVYRNRYHGTTAGGGSTVKHILLRYRGSVYQLLWNDVAVFTLAYYTLQVFYRRVIFDHQATREAFELACVYAARFLEFIPITFMTGFYVSEVVRRWWDQFLTIPRSQKVAYRLAAYLNGKVNQI